MPSGYLHQVCAEQVLEKSGATHVNVCTLVLGAQGPDPLFMMGMFPLSPSKRPLPYGHMLHTYRTGKFLCTLVQGAKAAGTAERSYAMGFLTHYALDSTVHPYVYAVSLNRRGKYSSLIHMNLEKHWDTLYYQRCGRRGISYVMPGISESRPQWEPIAALLSDTFTSVFPERPLTHQMVMGALADSERANRLAYSPRGIKYAAIWLAERVIGQPRLGTAQMAPHKPSGKDIVNAARKPWQNPANPEAERDDGLTELFDLAIGRGVELVRAACAYFDGRVEIDDFAQVAGNVGYGTGMESEP